MTLKPHFSLKSAWFINPGGQKHS